MSVPRRMRLVSVFVSVVEVGGFRAAGRKLALSPAQVSQAVKDLEADLGVALLYRSTRRLQLTRAAEDSLPYFREMVAQFEAGLAALNYQSPNEIRISAPTALAIPALAAALSDWQAQNSETRVELDISDRHQFRADTNADLFLRIGGPPDDMRVARLLCEISGFLAFRRGAFPVARKAEALLALPLAVPAGFKSGFPMVQRKTGAQVMVGAHPVFSVNNTQMLRELLLAGRVASPIFDFERATVLAGQEIENAAPDWSAGKLPVRVLYASDRPVLSPARSLVEHLAKVLPKALKQT